MSEIHQRNRLKNAYDNAWDLFHDNFDENYDEVTNALYRSTNDAIRLINAENVGAVIHCLRECQKEDLADQLLSAFEEASSTDDLFLEKVIEDGFLHPLKDKKFESVVNKIIDAYKMPKKETMTIQSIVERDGWNPVEIEYLSQRTVEDFVDYIKGLNKNANDYLRRLLKWRNVHGANEELREVSAIVIEALNRIGEEHPIQKSRIAKFNCDR
jgi:hypothetical protein